MSEFREALEKLTNAVEIYRSGNYGRAGAILNVATDEAKALLARGEPQSKLVDFGPHPSLPTSSHNANSVAAQSYLVEPAAAEKAREQSIEAAARAVVERYCGEYETSDGIMYGAIDTVVIALRDALKTAYELPSPPAATGEAKP